MPKIPVSSVRKTKWWSEAVGLSWTKAWILLRCCFDEKKLEMVKNYRLLLHLFCLTPSLAILSPVSSKINLSNDHVVRPRLYWKTAIRPKYFWHRDKFKVVAMEINLVVSLLIAQASDQSSGGWELRVAKPGISPILETLTRISIFWVGWVFDVFHLSEHHFLISRNWAHNFGRFEIRTRDGWERSRNATSVLSRPDNFLTSRYMQSCIQK